jgi:hypothetical protein
MLKIVKHLIDDETIQKLIDGCDEFTVNETPNETNHNYYFRKYIENHDGILNDYINQINDYNNQNFIVKYTVVNSWINRVTIETNKTDPPHYDDANLTFVTYLNDDYGGGEFEYFLDGKSFIIKPEKGLTLIMNDELFHRVLPIDDGIRYSLITFCRFGSKNKSTLI